MTHTLQLEVPEEVYTSLVRRARQAGRPPEQLALEWLAQASQLAADDPLEKFIGALNSRGSDWADRHDHYLAERPTARQTYSTRGKRAKPAKR